MKQCWSVFQSKLMSSMPIFLHRHLTAKYPILEGDDLLQEVEVKDPVQPVAQVEADLQLVMTRDSVRSTENWRGSPQNGRCQAAPSGPQVVPKLLRMVDPARSAENWRGSEIS